MCFVGGGVNIAIVTAMPPSFVYCIVNIKYFINFLYLIFYIIPRLRFLDVDTNPGQRRVVPAVCIILCSNVRSLAGNLCHLTVYSSQYEMLLCSESLVSCRYASHVGVAGDPRSISG